MVRIEEAGFWASTTAKEPDTVVGVKSTAGCKWGYKAIPRKIMPTIRGRRRRVAASPPNQPTITRDNTEVYTSITGILDAQHN